MSLDMYLATIIVLCLSAFAGCANITVSDDMVVTESMSVSDKHTAVVAAAQHNEKKTSHDIYIQDGKSGDGTAVAVEAAAEDTAEASVPTSDPPPSSSGTNSKSAAAAAGETEAKAEGDKESQEQTASGAMGIALSLGCVIVVAMGTTHL